MNYWQSASNRFAGRISGFYIGKRVKSACGYKRGKVVDLNQDEGIRVQWDSHDHPCWVIPESLRSDDFAALL